MQVKSLLVCTCAAQRTTMQQLAAATRGKRRHTHAQLLPKPGRARHDDGAAAHVAGQRVDVGHAAHDPLLCWLFCRWCLCAAQHAPRRAFEGGDGDEDSGVPVRVFMRQQRGVRAQDGGGGGGGSSLSKRRPPCSAAAHLAQGSPEVVVRDRVGVVEQRHAAERAAPRAREFGVGEMGASAVCAKRARFALARPRRTHFKACVR